jgi:hypothetical protein
MGGLIPEYVATGPDGNMWFATGGSIARVTTPPLATTESAAASAPTSASVTGTVDGHSQPTSFHIEYGPLGAATMSTPEQSLGTVSLATAVSGALTGLQPATTYQARVVATNPTGSEAGGFLTFKTPPPPVAVAALIRNLTITPSRFRAARHGATVTAARRRRATGATVTYSANRASIGTFTVIRLLPGRRHGRSCVKPGPHNRRAGHCTRLLVVGSFVRSDTVGPNRFHFSGRLHGRRLAPGRYRMRAVPFGIAPDGTPALASFAIRRG